MPKYQKKYQYKQEPLTAEEQVKMENACKNHRQKLVIFGLVDTGLRASEFVSLKRNDVDWQGQSIRIHGKGGIYGKRSKVRAVSLSERFAKLLEIQFAMANDMGMAKRTLQREVKVVANQAGLSRRVTAHTLRHTFAVNSIKKGISLRGLQQALGHDHITTTEIYLNYGDKNMLDEYKEKW